MSSDRGARVTFALRRAGVVGLSLVVVGSIVDRVRPEEITDRGFIATPFWWAAVVWAAVFVLDAAAFERSQLGRLEGVPLALGLGIGLAVLGTGIITVTDGSALQRLAYLVGNAAGAAAFWWAAIGLVWLLGPQRVNGVAPHHRL